MTSSFSRTGRRRAEQSHSLDPATRAGFLQAYGVPLAVWVLLCFVAAAAGIYALVMTRELGVSKPIFFVVLVALSMVPAIVLAYLLRSRVRLRWRGFDIGGPAGLAVALVYGGSTFWEEDRGVFLNVELATLTDDGVAGEARSDWMNPDLSVQLRAHGRSALGAVSVQSPQLRQFESPDGFSVGDDAILHIESRMHHHVFDAIQIYGQAKGVLGSVFEFDRPVRLERRGTIVVSARRLIDFSVRATIEDRRGRVSACSQEPLQVDYVGDSTLQGTTGLALPHLGQCLFAGRLPAPLPGAIVRVRKGNCSAPLSAFQGQIVSLACDG